jgi:hypothetical protein
MLSFPRKITVGLKPSKGKEFQNTICEAFIYAKGDDNQSATEDVGG